MNQKRGYDGIEGLGLYDDDAPRGMGDLFDDLTDVATGVATGVVDVVVPGAGLVTAATDIYNAATAPDPSQDPALTQVDPNQLAAANAAAAAGNAPTGPAYTPLPPPNAPTPTVVVVPGAPAPAAAAASPGIPTIAIVVAAGAVGLLAPDVVALLCLVAWAACGIVWGAK
jgi:hypothetical protein